MAIPWPRPTVRLRLAVTYTAMFVVAGVALLGVSYLLIQHREKGPATVARIICQRSVTGGSSGSASGVIVGPPGALALSPADCLGVVGTFYSHTATGQSGSSESGARWRRCRFPAASRYKSRDPPRLPSGSSPRR